jgi:ABC-type transport system involved in multi-copper enzyme maturation permease subunit
MIWVTWRQHRTEAIVAGILLILFSLFLLLTGLDLRNTSLRSGPLGVKAYIGSFPLIAIYSLPFLLGVFVGAPMVSQELERGTNRLAWTQGITRDHWFKSKTLIIAGATFVIFLLLAGVLNWWNQPVNQSIGPWSTFDANGFVMIAHALFALALGIALGVILGKPVSAMALFVLLFPVIRLFFIWLRQYYLPPKSLIWNYTGENPIENFSKIWILDQNFVDKFGQEIPFEQVFNVCHRITESTYIITSDPYSCYRENGFLTVMQYQPVERFWLFQSIESIIFLALALGLIGLTSWWLKKKIG